MSKIAFIGLGNMGEPMAANLVKAGHALADFEGTNEIMRVIVARGLVEN